MQFPPRQSVRTSSCPGQETAARRPPGRRGGLSPLAPPSPAPTPPPAPPSPPHGKGSEESCRPETCSDQKPGLAAPGQGWVRCLAHLSVRFCSSSTLSPSWLLPCLNSSLFTVWASQVALVVKNPPANAGDLRDVFLIPGSGRSPGGGQGNPFQYSCLENPHGQRNLAGYDP